MLEEIKTIKYVNHKGVQSQIKQIIKIKGKYINIGKYLSKMLILVQFKLKKKVHIKQLIISVINMFVTLQNMKYIIKKKHLRIHKIFNS